MKFTYIKLSKNQDKLNDKKGQNEVSDPSKINIERKKYSKGRRYLERKDRSDNQKILNVKSEERFLNRSYKNVEESNKNEEKKERAKKLLNKNQVALYTIALMLITSGYFNYTNKLKVASIGDAQLVNSNIIDESEITNELNEVNTEPNEVNETNIKNSEVNESSAVIKEENKINNTIETSVNEIVESSNKVNSEEYFTQTKLERDKMYSQMIETYEKILENNNISTEQKNTASEEIKNINNKRNGIATSETLIKAKGIEEVVIIVNSEVIDAIIKSEDNLSTEQVAQVSNIISRELNTNIENIHITTHK